MASKTVHVAVGVIKQGDQYFLTKRLADSHQGGKWEFPGGKLESNETEILLFVFEVVRHGARPPEHEDLPEFNFTVSPGMLTP